MGNRRKIRVPKIRKPIPPPGFAHKVHHIPHEQDEKEIIREQLEEMQEDELDKLLEDLELE